MNNFYFMKIVILSFFLKNSEMLMSCMPHITRSRAVRTTVEDMEGSNSKLSY